MGGAAIPRAVSKRTSNYLALIPEYGPNPTAQRKRKATVKSAGTISHCVALDRRGCTKEANGNGSAGSENDIERVALLVFLGRGVVDMM
jgi:hypothetical protein